MTLKKISKYLLLKNGFVVDPFHNETYEKDILLKDGKIFDIGKIKISDSYDIIDCSGKVITHGFCDLHVHFREPGREDKETLESGSIAAMSGGFTRVCVMPNTNPPLDSPESINFIIEKGENAPIHIHPIGAVSKGQGGKDITEMGLMHKEGAVAFSDDGLPIQDGAVMRIALEYSKLIDVPIINHAEDECLRDEGLMHEGTISTRLGLSGNPDLAESAMVNRDLELANYVGAKIHIPHVSSAKALDLIEKMKKYKNDVTSEVTPHHLFFNHEDLITYDTNLKVGPPIRTENDRKSLIDGLKKGIIDCIATDHAPHTIEDKETTFDLASFGMIGLETCFGVVNKVLCNDSNMKLSDLINTLTIKPRKVMGFDSDLFSKGKEAEITILDPNAKWIFQKENIKSKSINSPYIGKELIGRVLFTISKSKVYQNT